MGVAMKTDGKWRNFTSDNYTQGPKDDENSKYEEHDKTDTAEYRKEQLGYQSYFCIGVFFALVGGLLYFTSYGRESYLSYERDLTLKQQAAEEEARLERERLSRQQREYLERKSKEDSIRQSRLGPFSDA